VAEGTIETVGYSTFLNRSPKLFNVFSILMKSQIRQSVASTLALLAVTGCAGKSVGKIDISAELPKELPVELQQKFEIRDSSVNAQQQSKVVSASPVSAKATVAKLQAQSKNKALKASQVGAKAKTGGPADEAVPAVFEYPNRRPKIDPIWLAEKHVFEITYFGVAAGDFTLEVLPFKTMAERRVYHVRGTAISSSLFSMFYRLNDTVETYIDYDGLFSHRFHLVLDETKQARDSLELYDSEKRQTFYWNRWNRREKGYSEKKEFFPIESFSQDMLSSLYYLRTVPLPTGAVVTFPVVSEGKSWEAVVTVMRREVLDTPMGRVNTIVLKPETKLQGVLQKKGDSFLWLTDDERRFVVKLEAKVKIGTVVATLKNVDRGQTPGGGEAAQ